MKFWNVIERMIKYKISILSRILLEYFCRKNESSLFPIKLNFGQVYFLSYLPLPAFSLWIKRNEQKHKKEKRYLVQFWFTSFLSTHTTSNDFYLFDNTFLFLCEFNFSKTFEGYNFTGKGMCFWILVLYIQDKIPV